MRVTSSIWVGALIRRANGLGAAAVIQRRGAAEAGAIFIVVDRLDGTIDLYAPAPQAAFDEAWPDDRKFQRVVKTGQSADVASRIASEMRFDPDVWVVAIEDREGRVFFDVIESG